MAVVSDPGGTEITKGVAGGVDGAQPNGGEGNARILRVASRRGPLFRMEKGEGSGVHFQASNRLPEDGVGAGGGGREHL